MSNSAPQGQYDNPKLGMLLMITMASMLPVMDAIGKYLTDFLSPASIAFFRFILQTILFMSVLRLRKRVALPKEHLKTVILLGALICAVMLTLMLGVSVLPLATFVAIFFVEPLLLVFFSIWFLGEKVGWRRIIACCVGLVGALIIIRPNWATFGPYATMPLITAACMAGYFTVTKQIQGKVDGITVQGWATLIGTIFLGLVLLLGTTAKIDVLSVTFPEPTHWLWLLASALLGTIAYILVPEAFKRAPASLLAPFQYVEIVAATILGYYIFGDFPDAITWLGIAIILGAGLYVFYREQHTDQQ